MHLLCLRIDKSILRIHNTNTHTSRGVIQMTNKQPKTEKEFKEWLKVLIEEYKKENKKEVA